MAGSPSRDRIDSVPEPNSLILAGTGFGFLFVFGPLLPQLEDLTIRLALTAVILLVWAVANLLLELRRRGRDAALTTGLTAANTAEEAAALAHHELMEEGPGLVGRRTYRLPGCTRSGSADYQYRE